MSDTLNVEVDDFLEHYGVQGMKWGVRRDMNKTNVARLRSKGLTKRQAKKTNRAQNLVDAQRMAATGRQGKVNVLRQMNNRAISTQMLGFGTMAKHPLSVQKASVLQLKKNAELQTRIANGEKRITASLIKLQGVSIADLDYSIDDK